MDIWIDADACPGAIREIVLRGAQRVQVCVTFVANSSLRLPVSPLVRSVQVGRGMDVADAHIAAHAQKGDLAVTQDIPLAAALVAKGVTVIDVRGETLDEDNVAERLATRNLLTELRDAGMTLGGPAGFAATDKQRFAASFDRELTRLSRAKPSPR